MLTVLDAIHEIQHALGHVNGEKKQQLIQSLVALSHKLLEQLEGLNDIPAHFHDVLRPEIITRLDAAQKRNAEAAEAILSAVERMNPTLSRVEAGLRQELMKEINAVFEASTFQEPIARHLSEIRLCVEKLDKEMAALQAVLKGET